MTVEMSGDKTLSFLPLERLTPRMILGWTAPFLGGIFRLAVGRIGLRRSATRSPDGRLYARGWRLLTRVPAFFRLHPGVGRLSAKLRGSGGRAPSASRRHDLRVLQVMPPEADRQAAVQALLE